MAGDAGPGVSRLEELTKDELQALPRARTLVAIPIAPIEEHGPHLPLGTDGYLAEGLTDGVLDRLAERRPDWFLVRAPWIPLGCYTLEYPGSVEVPQVAVREVVAAFGHSLARWGFDKIAVLTGHGGPGHSAAIEEACREVSRRHGARMIYPIGRLITEVLDGRYTERFAERLGRDFSAEEQEVLAHDFHAGWWETSAILDRRPDLVRGDLAKLPLVRVSKVGMMRYYWGDRVGQGGGYMGDPRRADPRLGRAVEAVLCDEVTAIVERMLDGEDVSAEVSGEFYRNPLFRTAARPVARLLERVGRAVLGAWAKERR